MKRRKSISIFIIIVTVCIGIYVFCHRETANEYFLSQAKALAEQNADTTKEHAHDTSQKVQVVEQKIYFLKGKTLYCHSGESFHKNLVATNITNFLIFGENLYYLKGDYWGRCALFECKKDGSNPRKIAKNVTDFTVEEGIILYIQAIVEDEEDDTYDTHKIIEYNQETGKVKALYRFGDYSEEGGGKAIFLDSYIIIAETGNINIDIDVYDRKKNITRKFLKDAEGIMTLSTFIYQGNCYAAITYYYDEFSFFIPPVDFERTGIWKFDFEQNELVQVSKKYTCFSEVVGNELTLYNEFTFLPFLIKKSIMPFYPGMIYEKDSGL